VVGGRDETAVYGPGQVDKEGVPGRAPPDQTRFERLGSGQVREGQPFMSRSRERRVNPPSLTDGPHQDVPVERSHLLVLLSPFMGYVSSL